jgi:hypothetical protein
MNVTTVNNNITRAQSTARYPEFGNLKFQTDAQRFVNFGPTIQSDEGYLPSEAIEALLDSKSTMDCERLAATVTYKNALDKLGATKFNRRVRAVRIGAMPPFYKMNRYLAPIVDIVTVRQDQLQLGDWVFLKNVPNYQELSKKKFGRVHESTGEHLIVSGTNPLLFRGHVDIVEEGQTLAQWKQELFDSVPNNHRANIDDIDFSRDENGLIIARRIKD